MGRNADALRLLASCGLWSAAFSMLAEAEAEDKSAGQYLPPIHRVGGNGVGRSCSLPNPRLSFVGGGKEGTGRDRRVR